MLTPFEHRMLSLMQNSTDFALPIASDYTEAKKYGITQDIEVINLVSILHTFTLLLEWKAAEQNTFFLKEVNGCPQYVYPSDLPEAKIFGDCIKEREHLCCDCAQQTPAPQHRRGLIQAFQCHGINIEHLLRTQGLYPKGARPDGISQMTINEPASVPCNPANPFQINKQRYGN